MGQLSIARRLQVMIFTSVIALLVLCGAGYYSVSTVSSALRYSQEQTIPRLQSIGGVQSLFIKYHLAVIEHIQNDNIGKGQEFDKKISDIGQQLKNELDRFEATHQSDANNTEMLAIDKRLLQEYREASAKALDFSRNFLKNPAIQMVNTDVAPIRVKLEAALKAHADFNTQQARQQGELSSATARSAQIISATIGLAGIVTVIVIGVLLIRGINNSLRNMESVITRIEGDLDFTLRADAGKKDELGKMAELINSLLDNLQRNLKTLSQSASQVAGSSAQMAETSDHVAAASLQQSEAASSMAATVEEITVSINHVGDRAAEANQLSEESGKLAASGEKVISQTALDIKEIAETVSKAAVRIHELEAQGGKISAVVAVIKEVAEQTNLLALNAAIEAARAGEQGRGFAVVADEVRKLAERTAASTQEIAGTISTMQSTASSAAQSMQEAVDKVSQGVGRANHANDAIQQIGIGSRQVVEMVGEIATAIREQGTATNTIAGQVEKIAQMAEESSAASNESARAARELDRLAESMQKIVSSYRL